MKRVFICARVAPSGPGLPTFSAEHLDDYVKLAMEDARKRGGAPFPWRGYGYLDDSSYADRAFCLSACKAWLEAADLVVVYEDLGVSGGMKGEIALAESLNIPVERRRILSAQQEPLCPSP